MIKIEPQTDDYEDDVSMSLCPTSVSSDNYNEINQEKKPALSLCNQSNLEIELIKSEPRSVFDLRQPTPSIYKTEPDGNQETTVKNKSISIGRPLFVESDTIVSSGHGTVLSTPHVCQHCVKVFTTWKALRYHTYQQHKRSMNKRRKLNATDSDLICQFCDRKVASISGMKLHKVRHHGIRVQCYCKDCKKLIQNKMVIDHLLKVHLRKKVYACSLCDCTLPPSRHTNHDISRHGGLGNSKVIYNVIVYQEGIEQLRKTLITDANSTDGKSTQPITSFLYQFMDKFWSKWQPSDNLNWLARFKRSQRRKLRFFGWNC